MIRFYILLLMLLSGILFARETEEVQQLTVFFTNDLHGGIVPQKAEFLNPEFPPLLGGGASAAGIIRQVRREAENRGTVTLLIDGGDTFQGTLVGTLSKGEAVIEYMNRMQYDATVPGNHDFDLGKDNLIERIQQSQFPWIAANIYDKETGKLWEWVKPWVIVEKQGLRIGITGTATTGTAAMSFPDNIKGLEFRHEIPALQQAVNELRAAGADLVVALVHIGLPYDAREGYEELKQQTRESVMGDRYINAMEVARFVKGIDILLGGHLHRGYQQVWEDPVNHTICLQNYANGGNLGWVDFQIDPATKTIAGYDYAADENALLLLQQDQFWPDSTMAKFVKSQQALYEADFRGVIGETRSSVNRSSTGEAPLNNLLCDVLCERTGSDFSFMNFGGIRADIKSGPVTREDIFKVLPFGNEVVSFQAKGSFIKLILEQKLGGSSRGMAIGGARVVFNKTLPEGQRVVSAEIGGELLDPEKTYRIATTDYLMEGNSGLYMLRRIPREKVDFHGILLRDAVIEYFQQNTPISVKTDGRWKRDDGAQATEGWKGLFEF